MTALKDYPRIHLATGAASTSAGQAPRIDPQDADGLRRAAAKQRGKWIAIVDEGVRLWPEALNQSPEPELLGADTSIGYLSRVEMNGFANRAGLRLCRRARLAKTGTLPAAELHIPKFVGHWSSDATPKNAFKAGVSRTGTFMQDPAPAGPSRRDLALWGSLGADLRNGVWWLLGVNAALLDPGRVEEVRREADAFKGHGDGLVRLLHEIAREVRLERSIPVRPLTAALSRSARQLLSPWPAPRYWTEFVERCQRLGPDGTKLAADYRRAVDYLWGPLDG